MVLGTKESLQEATNYYSRNNAKATNNQEVTLAEEQEYQQAIIKALDGEELFDVVDNPTHIITVKDSEGNVVAQKQVSQTVENLDQTDYTTSTKISKYSSRSVCHGRHKKHDRP